LALEGVYDTEEEERERQPPTVIEEEEERFNSAWETMTSPKGQ